MLIGQIRLQNFVRRINAVLLMPSTLAISIIPTSLESQKTQSIMESLPLPLRSAPLKAIHHLFQANYEQLVEPLKMGPMFRLRL